MTKRDVLTVADLATSIGAVAAIGGAATGHVPVSVACAAGVASAGVGALSSWADTTAELHADAARRAVDPEYAHRLLMPGQGMRQTMSERSLWLALLAALLAVAAGGPWWPTPLVWVAAWSASGHRDRAIRALRRRDAEERLVRHEERLVEAERAADMARAKRAIAEREIEELLDVDPIETTRVREGE